MRKSAASPAVLAFVAVVLGTSVLLLVARRPPLTVEEVMANAGQLARLSAWTAVEATAGEAASNVTYTFGSRCGEVVGAAQLVQWTRSNRPAGPETVLELSLHPHRTGWLRASGRPAPPAVSLIRHAAGSDLAPAGAAADLTLSIRPGPPAGGAPDGPALAIDNRAGAGAFDQGSDRRLAAALRTVHCKLSERDLRLFAVLVRTLRARICDAPDTAGSPCADTALAVYRAAPGDRYWIELRPQGEASGMVAHLLDVSYSRGVLWRGRVRIIRQRTSLRRAADLFFVPPEERGALLAPTDPGFRQVPYRPALGGPVGGPVEVDFRALSGAAGGGPGDGRQSQDGGGSGRPAFPGTAPRAPLLYW